MDRMTRLASLDIDLGRFGAPGIAAAVVALTAWFAVVPAWHEYQQSQAQLALLSREVLEHQPLETQITRLQEELAALHRSIEGHDGELQAPALEAQVIGALQELSWQHQIELGGIEPTGLERVGSLERRVFEVSMTAGYHHLVAWLADLEDELGFAMVESFELTAGRTDEPAKLRVRLTIAVYREVA
jgi:hypothetical protein